MPTASAVVADMIDTAVGRTPITFRTLELWSNRESPVSIRPDNDLPSRYYLRLSVADEPGSLAKITSVLGEHQISISSLIQHEPDSQSKKPQVQLVIMTHEAPEGAARKAVEAITKLPVVKGLGVRMRVMEDIKI
jgi:homoserine dehydrogenase